MTSPSTTYDQHDNDGGLAPKLEDGSSLSSNSSSTSYHCIICYQEFPTDNDHNDYLDFNQRITISAAKLLKTFALSLNIPLEDKQPSISAYHLCQVCIEELEKLDKYYTQIQIITQQFEIIRNQFIKIMVNNYLKQKTDKTTAAGLLLTDDNKQWMSFVQQIVQQQQLNSTWEVNLERVNLGDHNKVDGWQRNVEDDAALLAIVKIEASNEEEESQLDMESCSLVSNTWSHINKSDAQISQDSSEGQLKSAPNEEKEAFVAEHILDDGEDYLLTTMPFRQKYEIIAPKRRIRTPMQKKKKKAGPTTTELKQQHKRKECAKKFQCEVCGKEFKRLAQLELHKDNCHNTNTNEEFLCEFCGMVFSSKILVRKHVYRVHKYKNKMRRKENEAFANQVYHFYKNVSGKNKLKTVEHFVKEGGKDARIIYRIIARCESSDSASYKKLPGRSMSTNSTENQKRIEREFMTNPTISVRQVATKLNIPRSTVSEVKVHKLGIKAHREGSTYLHAASSSLNQGS